MRNGTKSTNSDSESHWLIELHCMSAAQAAHPNLNHGIPLKQIGCTITVWVHISDEKKLNTGCWQINEGAGAEPCFSISVRSLSPQWRQMWGEEKKTQNTAHRVFKEQESLSVSFFLFSICSTASLWLLCSQSKWAHTLRTDMYLQRFWR